MKFLQTLNTKIKKKIKILLRDQFNTKVNFTKIVKPCKILFKKKTVKFLVSRPNMQYIVQHCFKFVLSRGIIIICRRTIV